MRRRRPTEQSGDRMTRRSLAVLVLVVWTVAGVGSPAPAKSNRTGCGGRAPDVTECEVTFVLTGEVIATGMTNGTNRDDDAFIGYMKGTWKSDTAERETECLFTNLGLANCWVLSDGEGVFEPGQEVTIRGQAVGVGPWRVYMRYR